MINSKQSYKVYFPLNLYSAKRQKLRCQFHLIQVVKLMLQIYSVLLVPFLLYSTMYKLSHLVLCPWRTRSKPPSLISKALILLSAVPCQHHSNKIGSKVGLRQQLQLINFKYIVYILSRKRFWNLSIMISNHERLHVVNP